MIQGLPPTPTGSTAFARWAKWVQDSILSLRPQPAQGQIVNQTSRGTSVIQSDPRRTPPPVWHPFKIYPASASNQFWVRSGIVEIAPKYWNGSYGTQSDAYYCLAIGEGADGILCDPTHPGLRTYPDGARRYGAKTLDFSSGAGVWWLYVAITYDNDIAIGPQYLVPTLTWSLGTFYDGWTGNPTSTATASGTLTNPIQNALRQNSDNILIGGVYFENGAFSQILQFVTHNLVDRYPLGANRYANVTTGNVIRPGDIYKLYDGGTYKLYVAKYATSFKLNDHMPPDSSYWVYLCDSGAD